MDRRLEKQVPITMARLVERVIRGIQRLFQVSQNSVSRLLLPNKNSISMMF
jgi:hypothetical protein